MRRAMCILFFLSMFYMAGCTGTVVYENDFENSFRYKPESQLDYLRYLGPEDSPQTPGENEWK